MRTPLVRRLISLAGAMLGITLSSSAHAGIALNREQAVNAVVSELGLGGYQLAWCPKVDYGFGALYEGILPAGTTVRPAEVNTLPFPGNVVTLENPMYLFFVDDTPNEKFTHAVRFVYVDPTVDNPSLAEGTIVVQQQGWWPVIQRPSQPEEVLFGPLSRFSGLPGGPTNPDGLVFGTMVSSRPQRPPAVVRPELPEPSPLSNANNCAIIASGVSPASVAAADRASIGAANDMETQLQNRGIPAGRIHKKLNAGKQDLRDAIKAVCNASPPCDKIYVHITSHGSNNAICLGPDGSVSADTLCAILKPLGEKGVPVCLMIDACHSGSLVDELRPKFPTGVIITSTDAANQAWGDDIDGAKGYMDFWYWAFRNCWNSAAADSNGDGTVDWKEAYRWVCNGNNGDVPWGGSNWDVKTKGPQLVGLPTKTHRWQGPVSGAWYVDIWRDTDQDGKFDQCDWGRDDDCDGTLDVIYLNNDSDEDGKNERTVCIRDVDDDGTPDTRYVFDDPNDDGNTDNITCFVWSGSDWIPTASAPRRSTNQYSINPPGGSRAGGTSFQLNAHGPIQWFNPNLTVFVGSEARPVQLLSPFQIVGETQGYLEGPRNVIVADFNPSSPSYGFDELVNGFHYDPELFVDRVDPAEGPCDTETPVTIFGFLFDPSAQVLVNGAPVPSVWTDGQTIQALMPAGFCATAVDVTVVNGPGGSPPRRGGPRPAAILLDEPFSYPDGPLVGNGGWTAHSGAGNKPIQVTSGTIRLEQSGGSGEDVNKPFAVQASTATTYACFVVSVPALGPGGGPPSWLAPEHFAHFRSSANPTFFRGRVYAGPPQGGGDYTLYISVTSSGTSPPVPWIADLVYGATYRVVSAYDAAAGTATLWVDPVTVASPSVSSGPFLVAAGETVDQYAFRQSSDNVSYQDVDDLVVGQTFEEVCPLPLAQATLEGAYAYLPAADDMPPSITCPGPLKLETGNDALARTPPGFGATGADETALYTVFRNHLGALSPGSHPIEFEAIDEAGNRTTCSAKVDVNLVTGVDPARHAAFALAGAAPNPYAGTGVIRFSLGRAERVRIMVYSPSGRRVATVLDGAREAGPHEIAWRAVDAGGRRLSSGIYFIEMEAGPFRATRRVAVLQ